MNAWSWFIEGRMRLMTMSFSKPADASLDGEEELGHAAGRELADERVLAELARKARDGRVTRRRRHLVPPRSLSIDGPVRRAPTRSAATLPATS